MTITEAKTAALQDWKVESTKDLPKYNTHIVHSLAKKRIPPLLELLQMASS